MTAPNIADVQVDHGDAGVDNQREDYSRKSRKRKRDTEVVEAQEGLTKARKKKHKGSAVIEDEDRKKRKKRDESCLQTEQGLSDPSATNKEGDRGLREGKKTKPLPANELGTLENNRKMPATETSPICTEELARSKRTKSTHRNKHDGVETGYILDPTQETRAGPEKSPKKKRKHNNGSVVDVDASELVEPHKKKKRDSQKNVDFPDPTEDTALSELGRKVLQYIHSRVSSHPDWKFNKARQNWLVRNVWDDAAVPETYFASCLKYLAGVQGNTRNLLIKSSTTLINPAPSDPKHDATSTDDSLLTNNLTVEPSEDLARRQKVKVDRAQAMLVALGVDVRSSN